MKKARQLTFDLGGPVLLEGIAYRGGDHSTSDDSSRYRPKDEIDYWNNERDSLRAMREFWKREGPKNETDCLDKYQADYKIKLMKELKRQRQLEFWPWEVMFEDVYCNKTRLQEQELKDMKRLVALYPNMMQPH